MTMTELNDPYRRFTLEICSKYSLNILLASIHRTEKRAAEKSLYFILILMFKKIFTVARKNILRTATDTTSVKTEDK
jgi:hypothetical protein